MRRALLWFKRYSLFILWFVFMALMCRDYFITDPPFSGSSSLHNKAGDLQQTALISFLELSFFYDILRPRSINRHSIGRILGAFCFSLLLIAIFSLSMPGHGVLAIHYWWLFCVNVILVVALAISSISVALHFLRKTAH